MIHRPPLLPVLLGSIAILIMALPGSALTVLPAGPEGDVLVAGHGETLAVELIVSGLGEGKPVNLTWSSQDRSLAGASTASVQNGTLLVHLAGSHLGIHEVEMTAEAQGETASTPLTVYILPTMTARIGLPGGEAGEILYAGGGETEAVLTVANTGPQPFEGDLQWGQWTWTQPVEAGASTDLSLVLPPEQGRQGYTEQLFALVDGERLPVVGPDGQVQSIGVERNPDRPLAMETGVVVHQGVGYLNATLLGIQSSMEVQVHFAGSTGGPPLPCGESIVHEATVHVARQRRTNLSIQTPWACEADLEAALTARVLDDGTQLEERAVWQARPDLPAYTPPRLRVGEALEGPPGWQVKLWRGSEAGPHYPRDWFSDADGAPRWPGTVDVWLVQDDMAGRVATGVTVEGASKPYASLGGALLPLIALLPLGRWP